MTTAIKSVSIGLELLKKAEEHKISLSEAVRVGICVILSELDDPNYINGLNIGRKITSLSKVLRETQTQLNLLQEKSLIENVIPKKEFELSRIRNTEQEDY